MSKKILPQEIGQALLVLSNYCKSQGTSCRETCGLFDDKSGVCALQKCSISDLMIKQEFCFSVEAK